MPETNNGNENLLAQKQKINDAKDACIVFFDGYCNLCNKSIDFIATRNSKRKLSFASLQSETAKDLLFEKVLKSVSPESILFLERGDVYSSSSAVLRLCFYMNQPFPHFRYLLFVPLWLRDGVYNWIARNRYSWFGKRKTCRQPTKAEEDMFLT